ncbi:MAG: acetoacetate decarboxylase [Deltaproteobacteria bacterium HGW-Deltaproteobacteria-1]|nr:MAG: acetoacetate decarboxylase [Deltaproteobacteria bacterium HGW-Deltaproteobacteria-1]
MGFVRSFQEIMANTKTTADFYDAEMLSVFWETEPAIIERLLPPPLKPAATPVAMAFVANYPKTGFGVTYRESALFVSAEYKGVEGNYCLAMPVTDDMAMVYGREYYGYPKKMAEVHITQNSDNFAGWTQRRGYRFMEVQAKLTGKFNDPEAEKKLAQRVNKDGAFSGIAFTYRFFPGPNAELADYNPWLVRQETVFRPKTIKFGEAEITFHNSPFDPWAEVEVVKMLGAVYMVGDSSMLPGQSVTRVDPIQFAPYAFKGTDM